MRQTLSQQDCCRYRWLLMAVLTALLCPVFAAFAPGQQKLVSFRLIPYHEQLRRRKLEAAAAAHPNRRWLGDDIPYGIHRKPQRRRTPQGQVLNTLYQGYGTHYVDLWCGTPTAQRQTVIVDTGSDFTAFPCLGCHDCGADIYHTDALYNQSASTSFHAFTCDECAAGFLCESNTCRFGVSYAEGSSWSAFESSDICYTGGPHNHPLAVSASAALSTVPPLSSKDSTDPGIASSFAFPFTFGCQTRLTGLFITQLDDGIMGLDTSDSAFWSQLYRAGKIQNKQFSLCFSRQNTVSRNGTQAGAMTLGGYDSRLHTSPMVYTSTSDGFSNGYSVYVRRVYLRQGGGGDSAAALGGYNVTAIDVSEEILNQEGSYRVDSGTTYTYFPTSLVEPFNHAWRKVTGRSYTQDPIRLTGDKLDQLPTILFQLRGDEVRNGQVLLKASSTDGVVTGLAGSLDPDHPLDVIVAFPPSHYMESYGRANLYAAQFYLDGSGNTIGANAIMGHDVTFDVTNSRIGWAESHCNHTALLESISIISAAPTPTPATNPTHSGKSKSGSKPTLAAKKKQPTRPTLKLGKGTGMPVTTKTLSTKKPVASLLRGEKTGAGNKPLPTKSATSNGGRPHHRLV